MRRFNMIIIAATVLFAARTPRAAEEACCRLHAGRSLMAPPPSGRQYAPDRLVDIQHVKIDVTPDYKKRTIGGTTTITFKVIAAPLKVLTLDAVNLEIGGVSASAPVEGWTNTGEAVVITFKDPLPPGEEGWVEVRHDAEPRKGIYFRTPEMGYKPEDTHLWSQGETHEARHWFPAYDYPNERATSEVICHVPRDMVVLSNGTLVEERDEPRTGLKVFRWLQEKPHANYLIALAAGKFKKIEGDHKGLPIAFYTPASQIGYAHDSFKDTADMLAFFEEETGTPYPWAKYFQVVVDDFTWGGMENTTLTILTDRTLHPATSEPIRSSMNLVAHELAHQWFGDYVTCKDWSQLWLNEGFATYYALLYTEHHLGRDQMNYELMKDAEQIFNHPAGGMVVDRTYADPQERFNAMPYEKGGWTLHMLRSQLGPGLYRKVVKTYLERNALRAVVTEDLNRVVEELSGRSYDPFFDQWTARPGFPTLDIAFSWDEGKKLAKVVIKQTQETKDGVPLFELPARLRFKGQAWQKDHEITIRDRQHEFHVPLAEQPGIVRFDPDHTILAKVNFNLPREMLFAQLADGSDAVGRLLALASLEKQTDQAVVAKVADAMRTDGFWAVRAEAAATLRKIRTDEALAALLDPGVQPDPRVRQAVARALGGFYDEKALKGLKRIAKEEPDDDVAASALEGLGRYDSDETRGLLASALKSDSWRNARADSAITAMRASDDPGHIPALRNALDSRGRDFTSFGYARGLEAIGYLARTLDRKEPVREYLVKHLAHPRRTVQGGAIRGLGELRDPRAIGPVRAFADGPEDDPLQKVAKEAIKSMGEARKVPVEMSDLRAEVEEMKKLNESLRKDMDDLKKRFDALKAAE